MAHDFLVHVLSFKKKLKQNKTEVLSIKYKSSFSDCFCKRVCRHEHIIVGYCHIMFVCSPFGGYRRDLQCSLSGVIVNRAAQFIAIQFSHDQCNCSISIRWELLWSVVVTGEDTANQETAA